MSKAKEPSQPQPKQKKPVLDVPGRKKYSSMKDYLKDLETTLAELHVNTTRRGR